MYVRYNTNNRTAVRNGCSKNAEFVIMYYTKEEYFMNSERRIRNNRIRRQRQLRRNLLMMCFTLALIATLSIGGFALGARAQDKEEVILYKYYTNVEVQYGDTLESIGEKYFCSDKYKNMKDYLADIMLVNGMYDDEVLPGSFLIVPYYSVEFK